MTSSSSKGITCPHCGAINHPDTLVVSDLGQYEGNPSTLKRRNGSRREQSQKVAKCAACGKPLPTRR